VTLVEFLLARLAEDEQMARAAGHGYGHLPVGRPLNAGWTQLDLTDNVRPAYDQRFLRQHGPARVLREVEVKRAIVESYQRKVESMRRYPNAGNASGVMALDGVVRLLALPYADHGLYQEEWRPEVRR